MSLFKLTTNIFFIIIGVIAALLIVSVFPVTGNYKIMVVQSGSMQPRIATGSLVVTKPADNYQVGQIITFRYGRASITHRINEIKTVNNDFIYITKGDANKASDKNEVRPDDIIGRVILAIPY